MCISPYEEGEEYVFDIHREMVKKAVAEDAQFTHSNQTVLFVEYLYIYMITLIINGYPLDIVYSEI